MKNKFIEVIDNKNSSNNDSLQTKCCDWDLFFSICSLKLLKRIFEININEENYEVCNLINKHIKIKENEKRN